MDSYNEVDLPALEMPSCKMLTYLQTTVSFDVSKKGEKWDKDLDKSQMPHVKQRTKQKPSYSTLIERPFKVTPLSRSFFSLKDLNIKIQITVLKATLFQK